MNGPRLFRQAEAKLKASAADPHLTPAERANLIAEAQVLATLAHTAATMDATLPLRSVGHSKWYSGREDT